jgi:hypothetical protein
MYTSGCTQVVQPLLSPGLFIAYSSLIRTVNNILGGVSFVLLAKMVGVQSSAGDEVKKTGNNT